MLQHSSAARPVQHRTEEFRTGQNSTILPTDGRQPFNHFTFKYPPHTLTQPSQSSFPPPGQPTSAMAETSHPRPVPDGRASLTSTTLHTEPSKSPPERPTTSHSPPSFVRGSSTGSGRQLEESPSSRRKKIRARGQVATVACTQGVMLRVLPQRLLKDTNNSIRHRIPKPSVDGVEDNCPE